MPIYEYQCASCGKKTEFIQSFSDPQPVKCPSCGGALKKLLSSPTAHFKGSGFHATDYGKPGGKPDDSSKGKEADGGTPSETGAGTQGDSAGDSSKEKKDSKDSSKESSTGKSDSGPSAAADAGTKREAPSSYPSSPSRKNTRRK